MASVGGALAKAANEKSKRMGKGYAKSASTSGGRNKNMPKTRVKAKSSTSTAKAKATAPKSVEKPVDMKETKGGNYPIYKKSGKKAASFRKAYATAKKGSNFTWDGRKYYKK